MKKLIYSVISLVLLSCNQNKSISLDDVISKGKWIDLTYSFNKQTPYWPNNPTTFELDTISEGMTPGGFYYSTYAFSEPEHGGTHLDAPVHFSKGGHSVDQVSLENLTGNAIVIDVSSKALENFDYLISKADIVNWENENGQIPEGTIVLFRTGYGQYYPDRKKYFGTDEMGPDAIPKLHFPGIDPEAASFLADQRKIKALGIDTPSMDYGQSKDFKTHQVLLGKGIPGFENVANMDKLPVSGFYVVALPMKIEHGSGGPLRIIAWVPESAN